MKSYRVRQRGWRFYRNWLIFMLMWVVILSIILDALRSPLPIYVYLILALPAYWVWSGVYNAYRITYPGGRFMMRQVTPKDAYLEYEKVEFPSRDGLMLFGWFVPGSNGGTIILVHGHGSKGIAMIYHASALAAKGYGVFMFDMRAHGSSGGDTCTNGWSEINDLLGAVDYLQSRDDADPEKIGVFGISMGGQVAIRGAAQAQNIKAVIAEGPNAATLEDHGGRPTTLMRWIKTPVNMFFYAMLSFMNGEKPPPGVLAEVGRTSPRPLLRAARLKPFCSRRRARKM